MSQSKLDFVLRRESVSRGRRFSPPLFLCVIVNLCLAAVQTSPCRAADAVEESARETLSILLRGNPSTGHLWSWTASGDGAVRETDIVYEQENEMPGSPATYTYVFAGEKEGEVTLRFVYSQSEPPPPNAPVNLYGLKVLSDKRVVLLDMREDIVGGPRTK